MALPPIKKTGTGFTNLNRYVAANKGSQVGSAIQSGVEGNVGKFRTGLASAQGKFGEDVSGAALGSDPNKAIRGEVLSKIGTLGTKGQVAGVGTAEEPKTITQADIDKFSTFRGGAYGGPQEIAGGAKFAGQAQNLQGLGTATKTGAGRQGLLQSFVGGNQYTQGQQKLDNLLLGRQAGKLGGINQAVRGIAGTTANQLGSARDLANLQAAQNRAFGVESQGLVDTAQTKEFSDLAADVAAKNTQYDTDIANLEKGLGTFDTSLSPGLQGLAGQYTYGLDPSSFLEIGRKATAGNIMTPEQEARLSALGQLRGTGTSNIPQMETDKFKAAGFNLGDFETAVGGAKTAAEQESAQFNEPLTQKAAEINAGENQMRGLDDQLAFFEKKSKEPQSILGGGLTPLEQAQWRKAAADRDQLRQQLAGRYSERKSLQEQQAALLKSLMGRQFK